MKNYSTFVQQRTFAVHVSNDSIKDFNQNFLQSELHPLERKDKGLHLILKKLNIKDDPSLLSILNRYLINKDIITNIHNQTKENLSYVFYIIHPPFIDFKTCINKRIPYTGSIEIFYVVSPDNLNSKCKSLLNLKKKLIEEKLDREYQKPFIFSKKKTDESSFLKEEVKKFLIQFEESIKSPYKDIENNSLIETHNNLLDFKYAERFLSLHIPGYKYDNSTARASIYYEGFLAVNYPYLRSDDITFEDRGNRLDTLRNCVFMKSQIITMPFITSRGTFILQNGREVKMEKSIGNSNGLSFQVENAGENPITGDIQSDLVSSVHFGLASEQKWQMNISNSLQNIYKLHKDLLIKESEYLFFNDDCINSIAIYNSYREIFKIGLEDFKIFKKINAINVNKKKDLLKWIDEFHHKIKTSPEISIIGDVYRLNLINNYRYHSNSTNIVQLEKTLCSLIGSKSFGIDGTLNLIFLNYLLNLIFELEKRKSYFYLEGLNYVENVNNTQKIRDAYDIISIVSYNIYDICKLIFEEKKTKDIPLDKKTSRLSGKQKYDILINMCKENIHKYIKSFKFYENMSKEEQHRFILDYDNNLIKFVFFPLVHDNLSISDYLNIIFIQLESFMRSYLDFRNTNISKYLVRGLQIFGLHSLENVRSDDLISCFLNSSTMHPDKTKLFEASSPYHLRSRYEGCIMVELSEDILREEINYPDSKSYYSLSRDFDINLNLGWNYLLENFDIVPVTKNSVESVNDEENIFDFVPPRGKSIGKYELKYLLDARNKKMISGWSLVGRTLVGIEVLRIKEESNSFEILTGKEIQDIKDSLKDKLTISVNDSWSYPDSAIENWDYSSDFTMMNQLPLSTRSVLKPSDVHNLRNLYSHFCSIEVTSELAQWLNQYTEMSFKGKEEEKPEDLVEKKLEKHIVYFYFSRKWNDSFEWSSEKEIAKKIEYILDHYFTANNSSLANSWKIDLSLFKKWVNQFHLFNWIIIQMLSEISSQNYMEFFIYSLFHDFKKFKLSDNRNINKQFYLKNLELYLNIFIQIEDNKKEKILAEIHKFILIWSARNFISSDIIYLNRLQLSGSEKSIYRSNYLKLFPLQKVKDDFIMEGNVNNLVLNDLSDLRSNDLKEKDLNNLYSNDFNMKSKSIIRVDDMKSFLEYGKEFDQELCTSLDQIMYLPSNTISKTNLEYLYKVTDRINFDFRIVNEYFSIENDILIINFMINAIDYFGEFKSEHDLSKKTVYTLRHNLEFLSDRLIRESVCNSLILRKESSFFLTEGKLDINSFHNTKDNERELQIFRTNLFFLSNLFSRLFGTHLVNMSNLEMKKHKEKLETRKNLGYYQFIKPLEKNYRAYVETLKNRNLLTILNDMTKVTFSGMHGKKDENTIVMEDRDIYPSYYGRLCLVKSPEGKFVGIVNYTSFHSRINKMGQIEVPYFKVFNGKLTGELVYLTSLEEKSHYITYSTEPYNKDGCLNGNFISCRYNNRFIVTNYLNISLHEAGTSFILSSVGSLIPFPETNASARVLMGSNMQTQAIQISIPHTPLVKSGEEQLLSSIITENNEVADSKLNSVSSDYEDKDCYFNDLNSSIENSSLVSLDLEEDSSILEDKKFISRPEKIKDICLGQNVLVGYVSVLGNTFEDSICISSKLVASGIFDHHITHIESSKDIVEADKVQLILKFFKRELKFSKSFDNFYFWLSRGLSTHCNVWSCSLVQVGQKVVKNQIISKSVMSFEFTGEFFKEFNKYCFKYMQIYSMDNQNKFKEEIFKVIKLIWTILDDKIKEHLFKNDFEHLKKFLLIFTTDRGISDLKSGYYVFPFPFPSIISKPIQFHIVRYKGEKIGSITSISKKSLYNESENSNKVSLLLSKFRHDYYHYMDSSNTGRADKMNKLINSYHDLFKCFLENDNHFFRFISYVYLFFMSCNIYSTKLNTQDISNKYSKELNQILFNFLDKLILDFLTSSDGISFNNYRMVDLVCNYNIYFKIQRLWMRRYEKDVQSLFDDIIFRLFRDRFYPTEETSFFLHKLIHQLNMLRDEYGELVTTNHSLPEEFALEFSPSCKNEDELELYQMYLYIKSKKLEITDQRRKYINYGLKSKTDNDKFAKKIIILDEIFRSSFCFSIEIYSKVYKEALSKIEEDSYLDISILETHSIQEGDKLTGRFGNKGVISKIVPFYEMPCLLDGTYLDIALNPLGVTSRMNLGQLLEVQLGYASFLMSIPLFNKSYSPDYSLEQYKVHNILQDKNMIYYMRNKSRSEFQSLLDSYESGMSQEVTSFKDRDYEKELKNLCDLHELKNNFRLEVSASIGGNLLHSKINVGIMYMFKLEHTGSKKVSARGVVGKTTWSSGQPASGKKHGGGQKYGEMEMSCFLGYGANRLLMELIGTKSGNNQTVHSLGRNLNQQKPLEHQQSSSTFDYLRSELENLGGTIVSKSGISSRSLKEDDNDTEN
tara:strand:+ start:7504 stop:14808 length:7305 start_codon:yes stop_codon:yes gene_type:complete